MGYFDELLSTNEEMRDTIRALLKICREQVDRSIRLTYLDGDLSIVENSSRLNAS